MRPSRLLILLLLLGVATEAEAEDYSVPTLEADLEQPASWWPAVSVVGSFAPTWTNNALFSRSDRRSDWYFDTNATIRLDGRFTNDLSYRLYVRSESDIFAHESGASESVAIGGARLTRDLAGWQVSAIYENRHVFAGFYEDHLFTANDVKLAVANEFTYKTVIFAPLVQGRYRFSNLPEARYYRLDLVLGIEVPLTDRWSVVSTPFVETYWFTSGENAGRSDQILSASLGLKYNITPRVSLTTTVAYETRLSNVAMRRYESVDVGPTLNFAF